MHYLRANTNRGYGTTEQVSPFSNTRAKPASTEDKTKMLTRVGVPVEFEAEPSAPDSEPPTLICFSHLRWNFVFQRPQHLMSRFAGEMDVVFWEEPIDIAANEAAFLEVHEAE